MSALQLLCENEQKETAPTTDRRAQERLLCSRVAPVRVLARPSFQPHRAFIRDVSTKGIGLVLSRPFEPGTVFAIQVQSRHTGVSGILSAQVKHSTQLAPNTWLMGCSLSRGLTDDEVYSIA